MPTEGVVEHNGWNEYAIEAVTRGEDVDPTDASRIASGNESVCEESECNSSGAGQDDAKGSKASDSGENL